MYIFDSCICDSYGNLIRVFLGENPLHSYAPWPYRYSPWPRCKMWIIHMWILTRGTKGWRGRDMYFVYRRLYGELLLIFLLHFNWISMSFYIYTYNKWFVTLSLLQSLVKLSRWPPYADFMIQVFVRFAASSPTVYFLQVKFMNKTLYCRMHFTFVFR